MKFSICIPNFNYEKYVGRTIQSVLASTYQDFEILVSDNASTDKSREVVQAVDDARIRLSVNACNVGFAGNLDRAARMATGEYMLMLSSDDLMKPTALETYRTLFDALKSDAPGAVITAACDVINPEDRTTASWGLLRGNIWRPSDRVSELESLVGAPVYRVAADEMLKRCLPNMQNPLYFLATIYPRALYHAVEGYGGGRCITPDKWFHWRLLGAAQSVLFVDKPLFGYRVHPANQNAQQSVLGALKDQVDDYLNTIEFDNALLLRLGLTREHLIEAFVEFGIARRALACLGRGDRQRAWRILTYGRACYPRHVRHNKNAWLLRALLALGPLGSWLGGRLYRRYKQSL